MKLGVVVEPEREHGRECLGMTSSTAGNAATPLSVEFIIRLVLDTSEHGGG